MFEADSFSEMFYQTCVRGYEKMSPEAADILRHAVTSQQGPDGLFCGRAGQEDLYYTFFGVLLALVTQVKFRRKECRNRMAAMDFSTLDLVHACAWLRVMEMFKLLALPKFLRQNAMTFKQFGVSQSDLEKLHSLDELPESAFPQRDKCSPYSRFLLGTLLADFGLDVPDADLTNYRLSNGLYANLKHHTDYGVNATAAALFLLPQGSQRDATVKSLAALQEPDGSFKAVASAPGGDLLSTATAVFALQRCGKTPQVSTKPYLRECFREDAFFAATPDDSHGDLEYTVYGLLTMGVLT